MKNGLLAVAVLAVIAYLFVPLESRWTPPLSDVTVIQFWHPWCGEYADALQEVVAEFNRKHPGIVAQPLFMPSTGGENMKFFVSVAGGVPPDVIVVDGTQVASWADLGVLQPLDDRLAAVGIIADDFWGPCWKQCRYNNKTWALSAAADANFALVWNKQSFREAGLDAERPPRTFKELQDYCDKLTRYDENGRIQRLGFAPTYMASGTNVIFTWGWVFGGTFFDEEAERFTCDDPRVIEAMEWQLSWCDRYGGRNRLRAFEAGFGDAAQSPFYVGKLAMQVMYIAEVQNIAKFAPNLEYGLAPLPGPEHGEIGSSWIGGWTIAMPYGGRGNDDAAFELIRWMTADPYGTTYMSRHMKLLPAYRKSPFLKEIKGDRILEAYYEILQNCKHSRPVTPANAYYMQQLHRAHSRSIERLISPADAFAEARKRTETHLAKIKAQTKADHVR